MSILLVGREVEGFYLQDLCQRFIKDGVAPSSIHVLFIDFTDFIYKHRDNAHQFDALKIIPRSNIHDFQNEFLKLVAKPRSFFQNFWFTHSESLAKFETKYGAHRNLWLQIMAEPKVYNNHYRDWFNFPDHGMLAALVLSWYEKLELLISNHDIKCVLDTNYPHLGRNILFEMCRSQGIPYLTPVVSRIGKSVYITDNFGLTTAPLVLERLNSSHLNVALGENYISHILKNLSSYFSHQQYEKMLRERQSIPKAFKFSGYNILRTLYIRSTKRKTAFRKWGGLHFNTTILRILRYWLRYFFRIVSLNLHSPFDLTFDIDKNPFVYYPLHAIPENSTIVNAPFHLEEMANIRKIARAIPFHQKLVVKEHMVMLGERPLAFYKEVSKIPNVVLINPQIKSMSLIQKASLTISITGTAALEATMFGRPAVILAKTDFDACEGIFRLENIEELPSLIKKLETYQVDMAKVTRFISALIEAGAEIDLGKLIYVHKPSTVDRMAYDQEAQKLYDLFKTEMKKKNVLS